MQNKSSLLFSRQSLFKTPVPFIILTLLCMALFTPHLEAKQNKTLRIATRIHSPFVMHSNNVYRGFTIDLWEKIANELNFKYELYTVKTHDDLITEIKTGRADLAFGGMTLTSKAEKAIDYTHPIFQTGLQIMIKEEKKSAIVAFLDNMISILSSPLLLKGIGILIVMLFIAANIIWITEHQKKQQNVPKKLPNRPF